MQRKKMFLVVCISALLAGAVQGQNFLPAKGKQVPEYLGWRRETFFSPMLPERDFSNPWKAAVGSFLPARGIRIEASRAWIMDRSGLQPGRMSLTGISASLPAEGALIPTDRVVTHFGFFCRQELELEKTIRLPLRFRLGSLEYCNRLEGK